MSESQVQPAIYVELARHLDSLPQRFPATGSGVELRILEKLFTPDEAAMAVNVRPKPEPARVIAGRVGADPEATAGLLASMSNRGLIFSLEREGKEAKYMAAPFVIGIWEYHVNDLDGELVALAREYLPVLFQANTDLPPQLRTIPVGASIEADIDIMAYEQAAEVVRGQTKFAVAPCICRREHQIAGQGCGKLEEACLVFGLGAEYYLRNGLAREISLEETLEILKKADEDGLVLQPSNAQRPTNICCCCGDCCQVLLNLRRQDKPALLAATPFVVQLEAEECLACGVCVDRCQMDALHLGEDDDAATLDADRCIGCGLCVTTCAGDALSLVRKPEELTAPVPATMMESYAALAKAREAGDLKTKAQRLKNSL